jgi:glutamate racemase
MNTKSRVLFGIATAVALFGVVAAGRVQDGSGQAPQAAGATFKVATFDSGFGGYFTAKAIEKQAGALSADGYGPFAIAHYGDTTNVPYGEKTPVEIARYASAGILAAFGDGARDVYVACNTASTQIDRIRELVRAQNPAFPNHVHSIIDVSVREVMKTVSAKLRTSDVATVAILATPATVKSEAYPRFLARALGVPAPVGRLTDKPQGRWLRSKGATIDSYNYVAELALGPRKKVIVYQFAPANWVEMIENGAPDAEKRDAVSRDLEMLVGSISRSGRFDVVGEFCTHYPVFDQMIRVQLAALGAAGPDTPFIVQGPLMGQLFRTRFLAGKPAKRDQPNPPPQTPPFYMSGTNIEAIRALVQKVFPGDPVPTIEHREFGK